MIRIRLSEPTVARTKIVISPLTELISALELLYRYGGRPPWPYTEWAGRARDVLRTMPGAAPLGVYGRLRETRRTGRTPDLFESVPEAALSFQRELEVLRQTPQALVDAQFGKHFPDRVPGYLVPYQRDRSRSFGALADSLAVFWQLAMEPYWPNVRTALDEEVLWRARSVVADGLETVLGNLQTAVRWDPPVLCLDKPVESDMATDGQRLLLVPSVFAGEEVTCSTDQPALLRLVYQARGSAVLAGSAGAALRDDDRLASLLGERRARVLRALATPATTSRLAVSLGLAPSTVSEQLAALRVAGAVQRRRSGRRVFYSLEPAGQALLSLFGTDATEPRAEDSLWPN